jgi:type III pantothenate kinase
VLLLDVGNSRCKWAYLENAAWLKQGVADHADWSPMRREFAALPMPSRIIISNVGGAEMVPRLQELCARWPAPLEFVLAQAGQCGVKNGYDDPSRLGSDRWAALIAAWQKMQRACLVVNCGTATTIDALSDKGEFLGGLILPGVTLMQQSLLQRTANLGETKGLPQNFPRNTADAIQSGVLRATLGAVDHQYDLLKSEAAVVCILSGGAADQIRPYLKMPVQQVEHLVLEGLQVIGEVSA